MSTGSFDNASAQTWVADLIAHSDPAPIRDAVKQALTDAGQADIEVLRQAIAAVEVVVAALGRATPVVRRQPALQAWLQRVQPSPEPALVLRSLQVLDMILLPDNALHRHWSQQAEFAQWHAHVTALRRQLQA